MPKVELHIHLEGSIRPETVLTLAKRHGVALPADSVEGLREWYTFRDFRHFVEVYVAVSQCLRKPEDIELVGRDLLDEQARQNVRHTEITYTASTIEQFVGIPWPDQLAALRQIRDYGREIGVSCGFIIDIVRGQTLERAREVSEWVAGALGDPVVALGIAGEEVRGTMQYGEVLRESAAREVPFVPHAGETVGPESIREVLAFDPVRIGHGVRCVEDRAVVRELVERQIPLEVCPTSNVALGVFPSLDDHPLPRLLDEGLRVTINSDDPPMFGTSITDEWARCAKAFDLDPDVMWSLTLNAADCALLPDAEKADLKERLRRDYQAVVELATR